MTIELITQPTTPPMSWKMFCKKYPKFSIGLDGFVKDRPQVDSNVPHANFDHHYGVSRLETRATCAQVLNAVRVGLFDLFKDDEGPQATVFVNDCDQDVCTSWTILKHHDLVKNPVNPAINRLVDVEDKLDTTGGAYPYPKSFPILGQIAWIYEPYTQFRLSGGLNLRSSSAFKSIITDVESRILEYLAGKGKSIPLDTRYKTICTKKNWTFVEEIGAQARTGMFSDGIKAYLSSSKRQNGNWNHILGRMSEFIPFQLPKILEDLKIAEGKQQDQWGGSTTIIGSPKINGSKLNPDEVMRIIDEHT